MRLQESTTPARETPHGLYVIIPRPLFATTYCLPPNRRAQFAPLLVEGQPVFHTTYSKNSLDPIGVHTARDSSTTELTKPALKKAKKLSALDKVL